MKTVLDSRKKYDVKVQVFRRRFFFFFFIQSDMDVQRGVRELNPGCLVLSIK